MSHLVTAAPSPALRPWVLQIQDAADRSGARHVRRELPQPYVSVLLGFGAPVSVAATGARETAFVAALDDHATLADESGWIGPQVDLTPAGARRLLGVDLRELSNRVIALSDVLPGADVLVERLAAAPDAAARFALLDAELGPRLADGPPARPDVARAQAIIVAAGGRIETRAVARELRCSRRHLSRRFGEEVGLPPSTFARVVRFRRALALAERGGAGWAAVAAECGYADQPHLVREVRALSGLAPNALLAERRASPFPAVQDAALAAA